MGFGKRGYLSNLLHEYQIISSRSRINGENVVDKVLSDFEKALRKIKWDIKAQLKDLRKIPNLRRAFKRDFKLKSSYVGKSWENDIEPDVMADRKVVKRWISKKVKKESFMFKNGDQAKRFFIDNYNEYIRLLIDDLKKLSGKSVIDYVMDIGGIDPRDASKEQIRDLTHEIIRKSQAVFEKSNVLSMNSDYAYEAMVRVAPDKMCEPLSVKGTFFKQELNLCLKTVDDKGLKYEGRLCQGDLGGPVVWVDDDGRYTQVAINSVSNASPILPVACQCSCR